MALFSKIDRCRICGNCQLEPVLDLGTMALTGVFPGPNTPDVPEAPLELVKCHSENGEDDHCGLLQLRHSFHAERMYGENYGYRSGLNQSMVDHLEAKVQSVLRRIQLDAGDLVLDVGSNDGTLLRAYPDLGLRLVGIDPTGLKFRPYYPDHVELIPEFFSTERIHAHCGGQRARLITSVSMFYDLEEPLEFMRQIRELLTDDGLWVFEQSYMPSMIEHTSYDTVCHEHLEFYSLRQIKWMADRAGLRIIDVEFNDINGGSFSVTAARSSSAHEACTGLVQSILEKERAGGYHSLRPYHEFRRSVVRHAGELKELLDRIEAEGGRVLGLGASTKGNVLLQYCGLDERHIPFIAEVNESKFGTRTPGTGIPIISEVDARSMKPDYFLVLPWHFRENLIERERGFLNQGGRLILPLPMIEIFAREAFGDTKDDEA